MVVSNLCMGAGDPHGAQGHGGNDEFGLPSDEGRVSSSSDGLASRLPLPLPPSSRGGRAKLEFRWACWLPPLPPRLAGCLSLPLSPPPSQRPGELKLVHARYPPPSLTTPELRAWFERKGKKEVGTNTRPCIFFLLTCTWALYFFYFLFTNQDAISTKIDIHATMGPNLTWFCKLRGYKISSIVLQEC